MSLVGLKVRLSRALEVNHPCCDNVCEICPGKGPHIAELRCAGCDYHRGWLSRATAYWLNAAISKHGRPTDPIDVPALEVAMISFWLDSVAMRDAKSESVPGLESDRAPPWEEDRP
jgi:hypothetical protein